jgi:hypothetical protein
MSETNSDSGSQIMYEDSTSLLIESLEEQVDDLIIKNQILKTVIQGLELRIKTLQEISDSELVNRIFQFL